jgi:hypothetical protein
MDRPNNADEVPAIDVGGGDAATSQSASAEWFRSRGEFSVGCVESVNGKAKLTMKKAYGFKSYNVAEWHSCIDLGSCQPSKSPTDSCEEACSIHLTSTHISNRYTRGGYDNWHTRYNIFAGEVMRSMDAPLPQKLSSDPMFRNATGLNNWLNSQDGRNAKWTRIDDSMAAGVQQLLNHVRAGRPALASLNSSVNTVSGQIAVIRPDQPRSVLSLGDVRIAQAGARNFANNTVNYGFGSTNDVDVFIHA